MVPKLPVPVIPLLLQGVKQGCPLSPLLFSLFINDVDDEFRTDFTGAVTGTEGLRVTHMLYADEAAPPTPPSIQQATCAPSNRCGITHGST